MKIDGGIGGPTGPTDAATAAAVLEAAGYDGVFTAEVNRDPFLPLALAASSTSRVELGTGIAVAFARNPMTLAQTAWDLQSMSQGRFILGLGSQIKPHITKRFSMPWSKPAARMSEMIRAIRAIWACWADGVPLAFRGEFYRHTLMTPMFTPPANPHGPPKIFLAGVGPRMTAVAATEADGFLCHGFTTPDYYRDVTLPTLEAGLAAAGRDRAEFEISMPTFVVTGADEDELAANLTRTKQQIAFYGSTPAYRPVLEHHGWGAVQDELNAMSKQGKWVEMAEVIDDDIADAFAVVAEPERLAEKIGARYGGLLDRLQFYAPYQSDPDRWLPVLDALKAI